MAQANLIDGRAIAVQIQGELAQRIAALRARGVRPGLAFVRVGEDPASKVYVGPIAGRIAPNRSGFGPMTIEMWMQDTVRAAEASL